MAGQTSTDPNVFILPDLGEGVHEAELINWKVSPGDHVEEHDVVAEMETDKALVEVPSPRAGTIKELFGNPGDIMKVGEPAWTYEGAPDQNGASSSPQQPEKTEEAPIDDGGEEIDEEREDYGTVVVNIDSQLGAVN